MAALAILICSIWASIIGAKLLTWEDGRRTTTPEIAIEAIVPGAYAGSVGEKLIVNVSDDIGWLQRLGWSRSPEIQIRMSALVDPGTKNMDHSWRIRLPEHAIKYQSTSKVTVIDEDGRTTYKWDTDDSVWTNAPSDRLVTLKPAIVWTTHKSDGSIAGYGMALFMMNIRVETLAVANIVEESGPSELWQLAWVPTRSMDDIWAAPGGSIEQLKNMLQPFEDQATAPKYADSYQLSACPSCLPSNGYAGAQAVDRSTWAVAGNFSQKELLSFSTTAYPWAWLSGAYWWLVGLIAAPIVGWLTNTLWSRVRPGLSSVPPRV